MAGMEGFEPPNVGTKSRCLTTWRHPTSGTDCTLISRSAQVTIINIMIYEPKLHG